MFSKIIFPILFLCFVIFSPLEATTFRIKLVQVTLKNKVVFVQGKAPLRDGTIVGINLFAKNHPGLWRKSYIKSGLFQCEFSLKKKKIIPGFYWIRAQFSPSHQSQTIYPTIPSDFLVLQGLRRIYLGDRKNSAQILAEHRSELFAHLKKLRKIYLQVWQYGHFYFVQSGQPKLSRRVRVIIPYLWEKFYRDYWQPKYGENRHLVRQYARRVFLSPYSSVHRSMGHIIAQLKKIFLLYTQKIYTNLHLFWPKYLADPEPVSRNLVPLHRELAGVFQKSFRILGTKKFIWPISAPIQIEKGQFIKENIYRSGTAYFQIEKPQNWMWDFTPMDPQIRVVIRPKSTYQKKTIPLLVSVQIINYFDKMKTTEQLRSAYKRNLLERYSKVVILKEQALRIPDHSTSSGFRPGYEIIHTVEGPKSVFTLRHYVIFGSQNIRTYAIVCYITRGKWEDHKKIVTKICESFRIFEGEQKKAEKQPGKKMDKKK